MNQPPPLWQFRSCYQHNMDKQSQLSQMERPFQWQQIKWELSVEKVTDQCLQ